MKRGIFLLIFLVLQRRRLAAARAVSIDQAMPDRPAHGAAPQKETDDIVQNMARAAAVFATQDRKDFEAKIDLDVFRRLAVQHFAAGEDQVKIVDSWARQSLLKIANKSRVEGKDPVYVALDMCFRSEYWLSRNMIYVRDIPIRRALADMSTSAAEQARVLKEGTVSPVFIAREDVQRMLEDIPLHDARLNESVGKTQSAWDTFISLESTFGAIPPAKSGAKWVLFAEISGHDPDVRQRMEAAKIPVRFPAGYDGSKGAELMQAWRELDAAWRQNKVDDANLAIHKLTGLLAAAQPEVYPSAFRRELELWYTRSFNGTIVALVYIVAMVLFLVAASGAAPRARKWAMGFFTVAVVCHLAAMLVRWYLAGRIPIQNQFESVLASALLGCVIGWVLEIWQKKSFYGMALSFVGFTAMTACLVMSFVMPGLIGENVKPVAGILSTFWLYIHVNTVICSYAMIAASFALGGLYLIAQLLHWISPIVEQEPALAGGTAAFSAEARRVSERRRNFLAAVDGANVVIMRLAFLFLGAGIAFGAMWADDSWGRPWGWDPKETFALVTWLVYLILVHVRFVAPGTKGPATAWLSVVGFAIMLFNWIGVNFLLVGLHSYA